MNATASHIDEGAAAAPTRTVGLLVVAIALSACTPATERASTAPAVEPRGGPVAARPVSESTAPAAASPLPALAAPVSPIVVPANALYVCVADTGGVSTQTVIEFQPNVGALCGKHPEMGPCRYERDVCRRSGGRVYAAGGREITLQTEAEYDRKVMRVRLQAN